MWRRGKRPVATHFLLITNIGNDALTIQMRWLGPWKKRADLFFGKFTYEGNSHHERDCKSQGEAFCRRRRSRWHEGNVRQPDDQGIYHQPDADAQGWRAGLQG